MNDFCVRVNDSGERLYKLYFYERWDECILLTEEELNKWFNEIRDMLNDESMSVWERMQKLVANL